MNVPVSVLLFGITRDLTGQSEVSVLVDEVAQVRDLLGHMHRAYPDFSSIKSLLVAVNGEYAEVDQLLGSNDEIALIPPVSGG